MIKLKLPVFVIIFIFLFSLSSLSIQNSNAFFSASSPIQNYTSSTLSHPEISITGNSDLVNQSKNEGWPGNGTKGNPFIISHYDISFSGNSKIGISIRSTNLYIKIENNSITQYFQYGMLIEDASNIVISNNFITGATVYDLSVINSPIIVDNNTFSGTYGLDAEFNSNITIEYNSFVSISNTVLNIIQCTNSLISKNNFFNTGPPGNILIKSSSNLNLTVNDVYSILPSNLYITSCKNIILKSNNFANTTINLFSAEKINLYNNSIINGEIYLSSSSYNVIQNNLLFMTSDFLNNVSNAIITEPVLLDSHCALFFTGFSDNNSILNNSFYNILGIELSDSSSNLFENNTFESMFYSLISANANFPSSSSFNKFIGNNFLDHSDNISLGTSITYFDNGTFGNYWKYQSTPVLVYSNGNISIYDNYPLTNPTSFINQTQMSITEIELSQMYTNYNYLVNTLQLNAYQYLLTYTSTNGSVNPNFVSTSTGTEQAITSTTPINLINNGYIKALIVILILGGISYYVFIRNNQQAERSRMNRNRMPNNQRQASNQTSTGQNQYNIQQLQKNRFCSNCLTKAEPEDIFCFACGHKLP